MDDLPNPPPPHTSVIPVTKRGSWLMSSVPTMLITRLDCLLEHSNDANDDDAYNDDSAEGDVPEVDVEDPDGHEDGEGDENHCENEIFSWQNAKKVQKNLKFLICKFRNFFLLLLPSRGTARDVGGIISAKRRKNTVRESRIEMQRVTCRKNYQLKITPLIFFPVTKLPSSPKAGTRQKLYQVYPPSPAV